MSDAIRIRTGSRGDAVTIAALATQVFLDTYATRGVRPDLAREAFHHYSGEAFSRRLAESARKFIVAEHDQGLVGFAEVLCADVTAPASSISGAELVRLYVQPRTQRGQLAPVVLFLFVPVFLFVFGRAEGIGTWQITPEGRAHQLGALKRGLVWFCIAGGITGIVSLVSSLLGHA